MPNRVLPEDCGTTRVNPFPMLLSWVTVGSCARPCVPDAPVDPRRRVPRHRGPGMDRYERSTVRGTGLSTLDAPTVAWSDLRRPFPWTRQRG